MRITQNRVQFPYRVSMPPTNRANFHYSPVTLPDVKAIDPFAPEVSHIGQAFSRACQKFASQSAMSCKGTRLTFAQLDKLAGHFGGFLQQRLKIQKGDRIAIMVPNLLQFPVAFLGAQKIGAICVNINPQFTAPEMQKQLADSGAKAIVILDLFMDRLESIMGQTQLAHVIPTSVGDLFPMVKRVIAQWMVKRKTKIPTHRLKTVSFRQALAAKCGGALQPALLGNDDIAVLQYTGGTTGIPKAAMLTHGNILANMRQMQAVTKDIVRDGQDVVLNVLPLYHIFSLTINFLTLACKGVENILVPKPTSATIIEAFRKHPDIHIFPAVNTQFNDLLNNGLFKNHLPKNLRLVIAGGTALQSCVQQRWLEVVGIPINQGYGLTEASPLVAVGPLGQIDRPGSIGVPVSDTLVRLLNDEGKVVEPGMPGELCIRGPQVMRGYWQRPDETQLVIDHDGFLRTGDIAREDRDGFLYIVDRKKDLIIVDGHNVYPNEIEEAFAKHPEVKEVAAIAVSAAGTGERPKVFIVPRDASVVGDKEKQTALRRNLMEYCQSCLVNYAWPRHYEFRESLPRSNVGKVLRRELRDRPNT